MGNTAFLISTEKNKRLYPTHLNFGENTFISFDKNIYVTCVHSLIAYSIKIFSFLNNYFPISYKPFVLTRRFFNKINRAEPMSFQIISFIISLNYFNGYCHVKKTR